MTTKILAVLALALFISACEPNSNEPNPAASPTVQPAATPTATTTNETNHPAPNIAVKTGDKVKVTVNGSPVEATVVSVDEKTAKAIVKVAGETKERTVNLSEIVKQ